MGHCTKLSTFTSAQLSNLASLLPPTSQTRSNSFIGLSPSDLYMQARDQPYSSRPRATLPLLELFQHPELNESGVD